MGPTSWLVYFPPGQYRQAVKLLEDARDSGVFPASLPAGYTLKRITEGPYGNTYETLSSGLFSRHQ